MSLVVLILYRYDTTGDPALKPVAQRIARILSPALQPMPGASNA